MTMTSDRSAVDIEALGVEVSPRPSTTPALVGRDRELRTLDGVIGDVLSGSGRVVSLIGEAGLGKSALLDTFLQRVGDAGLPAWRTLGRQLEQARPLGPLVELIREIGAGAALDQLADPMRDSTVRMSSDNGVEFALVEMLVDLLEAKAGTQPFVVVIDDAHWADAATVRCLRLLGARLIASGACLVVASRPLPDQNPLTRQLDSMAAGAVVLRVGPLDTGAARRVAESHSVVDLSSATLDDIVASAGGSPLLIGALTARRSSIGGRDPIASAINSLSESTLSILRHAAVASVKIDIDLLRELLPIRPLAIVDALDEAEIAGVVVRSPSWHFAHDLFHEVIYASIDSSIRRGMHLETAAVLRRAGRPAIDIAEQYRRGALPGNLEAVEAVHRAANSVAAIAPSAALELFDAAISLCGQAGPSVELLADHLQALAWTGDLDAADSIGELLIGRDLAPEVAYRVRHELAFTTFVRGSIAETLEHLRHAALHATTPSLAARAASERALASLTNGDSAGASAFAGDGLRLGRSSGDAAAVGLASAVVSLLALYRLDLPTAQTHADAVERLASGPMGREVAIYQPQLFSALVAFESDDELGANDILQRARARAAETGTTWAVPMYDAITAYQALRRGRLGDARASAIGGSSLAAAADAFAGGAWCDGLQAQVEILTGNLALAEQLVIRAEAAYRQPQTKFGPEQAVLARAWLLERSGESSAVLAHLREAWDFFSALEFGSSMLAVAGDLARHAHEAGDGHLSSSVAEQTHLLAHRSGLASHRAIQLRVEAWRDGDADVMGRSVELFVEQDYLTAAALTSVDHAQLARERSDLASARRALDHAGDLFRAIGADAEADRVLGTASRVRRPRHGWGALTVTEQRVVALVAGGMSNPEIAAELFVSRRTVESHVAAALRKLEARSRTALAAYVHQRDVDMLGTGTKLR